MYYVTTWVNGAQVLTGPFTLIEAKKEFKGKCKVGTKNENRHAS